MNARVEAVGTELESYPSSDSSQAIIPARVRIELDGKGDNALTFQTLNEALWVARLFMLAIAKRLLDPNADTTAQVTEAISQAISRSTNVTAMLLDWNTVCEDFEAMVTRMEAENLTREIQG